MKGKDGNGTGARRVAVRVYAGLFPFPDRPVEVFLVVQPKNIAEVGSFKEFEADLERFCLWYAFLGEVWCEQFDMSILRAAIRELVPAWEEKGSPKIGGKGESLGNAPDLPMPDSSLAELRVYVVGRPNTLHA